MAIQVLPSTGDSIAGTITGLAGSIDKYLNPNRDLQIAMQKAMAVNPELIQHMADLEANNPGYTARLGLGPDLSSIVSSIGQSAASQAETATRPGAAKQAVAQQAATTSTADLTVNKDKLNSDIIQKAGKIMGADPSISFSAALKTLTGQTEEERTSAQRKGKIEEASLSPQLQALQRAGDLPKDLNNVDWAQEARDFMDGKIPGRAAAYLNPANPDIAKTFTEALDAEKLRRRLEVEKYIASLHGDKSIDNFQIQSAFHEYQKSGGTGTLQAWKGLLFDPKAQDRARELMADPSKATTPEDKNLLATANVTKQQIDLDKLRDITLVNNNINGQLKTIDKAETDEERTAAISGLNQLLKARGTLGGIQVQAVWTKRPWYQSDKLEFHDANGKQVPTEKVNAQLADPYASDITTASQLPPAGKAAIDLIIKSKDPGAALGKLKMQDTSPGKTVSAEVEKELIKQGVIKRMGASPVVTP
jgi:hypothetical protein